MKARAVSYRASDRMKWLGVLALVLLIAGAGIVGIASVARADDDDGTTRFVPRQAVVQLKPGVRLGKFLNDYNATRRDTLLIYNNKRVYLLQLKGQRVNTRAKVAAMNRDRRTVFAEPNFIVDTPEGGGRSFRAWGQNSTGPDTTNAYAFRNMNLSCTRQITQGRGAVVAVIDTGVALNHPYLRDRLTAKRYDFLRGDTQPFDRRQNRDTDGDGQKDEMWGHGTHVAGIVAYTAPQARIMPLRVLDSNGRGNVFAIAEAIKFAERNGANVINMSFGTSAESELLDDVIDDVDDEIVVVSAAGNRGNAIKQYPAAEEGLSVTATAGQKQRPAWANYGAWVNVAAPGVRVRSSVPGGYANWNGTSMAAPFIAGQAALMYSAAPPDVKRDDDVAEEIENIIRRTFNQRVANTNGGHADAGRSLATIMRGQNTGNCGRGVPALYPEVEDDD
jgi:thermitase